MMLETKYKFLKQRRYRITFEKPEDVFFRVLIPSDVFRECEKRLESVMDLPPV